MGSSVRAPVEVQFKASGVDAVRSGIRLVRGEASSASSAAGQLGDSYSQGSSKLVSGAQRAAGAVSMVAASAKCGRSSSPAPTWRSRSASAARSSRRKEIEDTNKRVVEGVQSARRANSLESVAKEVGTLYQGDRTAIKGEPGHEKEADAQSVGRSRGLEGLTQQKEQLDANARRG